MGRGRVAVSREFHSQPRGQGRETDRNRDHTIVTSDSLGSVTFWDGASFAQRQTFSAHSADGMCLTVGPVCPLIPLSDNIRSNNSPLTDAVW